MGWYLWLEVVICFWMVVLNVEEVEQSVCVSVKPLCRYLFRLDKPFADCSNSPGSPTEVRVRSAEAVAGWRSGWCFFHRSDPELPTSTLCPRTGAVRQRGKACAAFFVCSDSAFCLPCLLVALACESLQLLGRIVWGHFALWPSCFMDCVGRRDFCDFKLFFWLFAGNNMLKIPQFACVFSPSLVWEITLLRYNLNVRELETKNPVFGVLFKPSVWCIFLFLYDVCIYRVLLL